MPRASCYLSYALALVFAAHAPAAFGAPTEHARQPVRRRRRLSLRRLRLRAAIGLRKVLFGEVHTHAGRLWQRKRSSLREVSRSREPARPQRTDAVSDPKYLAALLAVGNHHLPPPAPGTVRVYRRTSAPHKTQMSVHQRERRAKDPHVKIASGELEFLWYTEARLHAGTLHDDAVSATTSEKIARDKLLVYGSHLIAYDIPQAVFDKLPAGDPLLAEVVFKHSIPDKFAVAVIPIRPAQSPRKK